MNAATFTSKPRTSHEWSVEVAALELQVQHLKNRLAWFEKHVFGARSEKVPAAPGAESLSLFPTPANGTEKPQTVPVLQNPGAPKEKSTPRRRPWPKNLARVCETLLPPEGTLSCACCGTRKEKIGEDVTESLERAKVQHYVRSVSRPKFACPRCPEEGVVQSPVERRFIEKGNIGDSVVAQVALDKYLNHRVSRMRPRLSWLQCCSNDEGRPLGTGVQAQVSNPLVLLRPKSGVVSDKEKASLRCQVGIEKTNENEPLMKHRKVFRRCRNRGGWLSREKSRGNLRTIWAASGVKAASVRYRHLDGTREPMLQWQGRTLSGSPMRRRVPRCGIGAEPFVVAMKAL